MQVELAKKKHIFCKNKMKRKLFLYTNEVKKCHPETSEFSCFLYCVLAVGGRRHFKVGHVGKKRELRHAHSTPSFKLSGGHLRAGKKS